MTGAYAAIMRRMTTAEKAAIDARIDELAAEIRELAREVGALTRPPAPASPAPPRLAAA